MAFGVESNNQDFHDVFTLYMVIALAVTALVFGAITYTVIRYRHRDGSRTRDVRGLKPLEAIWVALIAGVVVVLLVTTFRANDRIVAVSSNPAQTVRVIAFQWGWRFSYRDAGVTVTGSSQRPPTLVVPAEEPVRFVLSSRDVIHSFWTPELKFKRDAFPNRLTEFDMVFDPGVTTVGRCAEFCGLRHDSMGFQVVAMADGEFRRWLRDHEPGEGA
jgi:cytochrome c oxidase subunit II